MQKDLPFSQSFPHQAKFVVFQVSQPTMDQFAAGGRGGRGQIILFAQCNGEPPGAGFSRYAASVDAATHDEQVVTV